MIHSGMRRFVLASLLLSVSVSLRAAESCKLSPLMHQRKDVATILHLEDTWNTAYLRGDTNLERCLLAPDFTEIMRNGEVLRLSEELGLAAKNRGKALPIPPQPKIAVLLHGDVAVAYGKSLSVEAGGKAHIRYYADSYIWENGAWHAYFAQQTQTESQ